MLITLDFETYFSTKQKYDLRNISITEYIHDDRFYVQGMGLKVDDTETAWISGKDVGTALSLIDWENAEVIGHNLKFDGAILAWKYGVKPKRWIDTKAMAKAVLGSSLPSASLKTVGDHLGLPAKGELNTNGLKELTAEQEEELAEYCKRDTDIAYGIYQKLLPKFPEKQLKIVDWTVRAFVNPQLEIDGDKCLEIYERIVEEKKERVAKTGIDADVFRSNKKFPELLKAEGFSVPMKKNKDGKEIPALAMSDEGFLDMLESEDQRLRSLAQARQAVKQVLEETRAKKLYQVSKLSGYCFDVIFSGAQQTHRFSGGDGCAGNPQNFKRGSGLREAIIAPEGKTLVVADFSNIELRVLAFLSKDPLLMEAIKNKEDVYSKFGSQIYNKPINKKDNPDERAVGKQAVLGLGYGMGPKKFKHTVLTQADQVITEEFAKEVVDLYRTTYTGVPKFWKICDSILEKIAGNSFGSFPTVPFLGLGKPQIILPGGLEIKYPHLTFRWVKWYDKFKKEWIYKRYKSKKGQMDDVKIYGGMVTENICQALAGVICKEAISRLIDYGYAPLGMVHDELLVVCDEDEVEKVKYLVECAMTQPMDWWPELPLEVEIGSGRSWYEAK